jgi:hypothetical protein
VGQGRPGLTLELRETRGDLREVLEPRRTLSEIPLEPAQRQGDDLIPDRPIRGALVVLLCGSLLHAEVYKREGKESGRTSTVSAGLTSRSRIS